MVKLAGGAKLAVPCALVEAADRLAGAQRQAARVERHGEAGRVVKLAALPKPAVARLLVEVAHRVAGALREAGHLGVACRRERGGRGRAAAACCRDGKGAGERVRAGMQAAD